MMLLELGKASLKFKIGDFMDLKNFHSDTLEWHESTRAILSGPK